MGFDPVISLFLFIILSYFSFTNAHSQVRNEEKAKRMLGPDVDMIKGDSPEMVEYIGMQNVINAVKKNVGLQNGKLLFGFQDNLSADSPWGALDDVAMGGVSESTFQVDPTDNESAGPTGLFKG
ncbi:hypothetical protein IFM89_004710 [Coptis chinensis]|uniref:Uncharacterized protein n=1 Tax=Coptis chinensis TaxID=261450 RepID=A0A835GXG7_9MAGN|nr:hypothetical protein IFM89_004710 [Coptis chinensis]